MNCGCGAFGDSSCGCSKDSGAGCASVNTCGNSYKLSVFDWLSNVTSPRKRQQEFVEVRFKNDRKGIYQNSAQLPLHVGSIVAVESSPGHDLGTVSLTGELVEMQMKRKRKSAEDALKIYRLASQKDMDVWQQAKNREEGIKVEAGKIAQRLFLEMKITDVEFQGDSTKATFYYTAEGRIDFRLLVKEYASVFKMKIEMKQIGYRQEAAKVGGVGSCGRELCCSSWLSDFRSVNTNVARYQQLSINPLKLAGQCGKLKCCLNYELDSYLDALNYFPSSNTVLETEKGKAYCIKIDVFKGKMWFAYTENSSLWIELDTRSVQEIAQSNKDGKKVGSLEQYQNKEIVPVSIDLIQENKVDRFESKKPKKNTKKPVDKSVEETEKKVVLKPKNQEGEAKSEDIEPKKNKKPYRKKPKRKPPTD